MATYLDTDLLRAVLDRLGLILLATVMLSLHNRILFLNPFKFFQVQLVERHLDRLLRFFIFELMGHLHVLFIYNYFNCILEFIFSYKVIYY